MAAWSVGPVEMLSRGWRRASHGWDMNREIPTCSGHVSSDDPTMMVSKFKPQDPSLPKPVPTGSFRPSRTLVKVLHALILGGWTHPRRLDEQLEVSLCSDRPTSKPNGVPEPWAFKGLSPKNPCFRKVFRLQNQVKPVAWKT